MKRTDHSSTEYRFTEDEVKDALLKLAGEERSATKINTFLSSHYTTNSIGPTFKLTIRER